MFYKDKLLPLLLLIFLFAVLLRFYYLYPSNITFGFDQARDLSAARAIVKNLDLRIVGPTAGNNANLHHGVLYLYYVLAPLLIFAGNPFWIAFTNAIVNASLCLVLYFFAKSLFNDRIIGLIAAVLAAVSYYLVQYSGWLSNPTVTLFTVPLFFFGLWKYIQGEKYGLVLSAFFLGLTIEFEIFFIYLVPIALIIWFVFRPGFPDLRTILLSVISFCLATLTMILTEIKFGFTGVKELIGMGGGVGANRVEILKNMLVRLAETFDTTLFPGPIHILSVILFGIFLIVAFEIVKGKPGAIVFLFIYLLSPLIMVFVGYHAAPWFLVGAPPAIILMFAWLVSRLRYRPLMLFFLLIVVWGNILMIKNTRGIGQTLLEPDISSLLSKQLQVVDYTYTESQGAPFTVNTVTNPLYINAVWSYHYDWYGREKYGVFPTWSGGDQLPPYNILPSENGQEKYLYLIMDMTDRVPTVHRILACQWADKKGKFQTELVLEGIVVKKYLLSADK